MWNLLTNWIDNWFNTNNLEIKIKLNKFNINGTTNINKCNLYINKLSSFKLNNKYSKLNIINKNKLVTYKINNNTLNKINVN